MPAIISILTRGLRHAVVGVAVMAVLMMTLGVHLHMVHVETADGQDHRAQLSLGSMSESSGVDPCAPQPLDPDGCGHCQCPSSTTVVAPEAVSIPLFTCVAAITRDVHVVSIPDGLSHPPDLPPARLS